MTVKILAVGDVCGTVGLDFLHRVLKNYKQKNGIDFCVVNGENANVVGVTPKQCDSILRAGADVVTLGNHTWTRWELQPYLDESRRVIRPANFAPHCPGAGDVVINADFGKVEVINLIGKYGLDTNTDNPFVVVDSILQEPGADIILVDFSAPHLMPCHDVMNALVFSAKGGDVAMTMVDGKILYQNGSFPTLDLGSVVQEMMEYAIPRLMKE